MGNNKRQVYINNAFWRLCIGIVITIQLVVLFPSLLSKHTINFDAAMYYYVLSIMAAIVLVVQYTLGSFGYTVYSLLSLIRLWLREKGKAFECFSCDKTLPTSMRGGFIKWMGDATPICQSCHQRAAIAFGDKIVVGKTEDDTSMNECSTILASRILDNVVEETN